MKLKFIKNKKCKKYMMLLFLVIIIILELGTFINKNIRSERKEPEIIKQDEKMSLKDIVDNFNSKNIGILSINEVEDGYHIIVEVKTKISDFDKKFDLLKTYNVESYDIEEKGDELYGSITINN